MRRLVVVGLWLVLVASVSTVVWQVIGSTGTQLYADRSQSVVPELPVTSAVPTADASRKPRPHKRHHNSPQPTATDHASPSTLNPTSRPSKSATSKPVAAVSRAWRGEAGTVIVQCRGSYITLEGANPNAGWRIEVERGSRQVKVSFHQGDEGAEVEVQASCSGGSPVFEVSKGD